MTTRRFNAIAYSHKLSDAGLDKKIADVQAEELSNLITDDLVTKEYLDNKLNSMLIKIGGMLAAAISILFVLLKYHA